VIEPVNTARTFRAVAAWLEEDIDAVTRILGEIDGDSEALEDVVLVLLRLLGYEIGSGNHRDAWGFYIQDMLIGPTNSAPDFVPDFGTSTDG
jgi:hypothetical protein